MAFDWQVPPADASESRRIGWLNEVCQSGNAWNKSQPGFADWKKSLEILNGQPPREDVEQFRHYFSGHRLRTNVRTAKEALANIRPIWGFHGRKGIEKQAMMMNKTSRALYLQHYWGEDIKDWLAYAMATNTGWMRPVYRRDRAGAGKGRIELLTYGQPCVLPFQMPASGDYNQAYVTTLVDEIPVWEAHSRFPLHQDRLTPTKSQIWYSTEIRSASEKNARKSIPFNPFNPLSWGRKSHEQKFDCYIPFRWSTIIDNEINFSGTARIMGQPNTPWYYEVPYVGQEIFSHYDADHKPVGRKATEDDARLYPYRRLMIASEDCICYDGPSFNWHGDIDLIPLSVDRWPWAPAGFSMVHDAYGIERQLSALDSGIMERVRAQNNPPLGYDLNSLTIKEAREFHPMDTDNVRIGYDGSELEGTPYKLLVPPEVYEVSPEQLAFREKLVESIDYTMQTRDITELSKAKILGSDMNALEKTLSSLGPIVRGIGMSMEEAVGKVGNQIGWLIHEFMTTAQIMSYIDPESMAVETFDYDPSQLYPSHLPDEMVHGPDQSPMTSQYSRYQRSKWMLQQMPFYNLPGSMHDIHQMTTALMAMQMKARGMHIPDSFCMISAGMPNVKEPEGNFLQEQYETEQEDQMALQIRLAVMAKQAGIEQHLIPDPAEAAPAGPGGAPAPVSTGGSKGGRPPTAQVAPHLEVKDGGRPTISESP